MNESVTGKVIVITGGSMGFGKALAERLRSCGNTVVTLSRKAEENGRDVFRCDVSDPQAVESVFVKIGELYKKIDILINNAGFGQSGAVELLASERLEYITKTNFLGPVYCAKYALPYMETGSKVLNIGSMSAFIPMPFRTMYSATKSGVNSFSLGLAMELKGTGIEVSAVCLGDIQTEFALHREISDATNPRYGKRIAEVDEFVTSRPMSKRIPLENALRRLCRIAAKKRLYPIYIVGTKYRLLYALNKILPIKLLSVLVLLFFREEK